MKLSIFKLFNDLKKPDYRRLYYLVFRYLNIFKTIYFNFKVLPFRQAVKFPIWIYGRVSFVSTRGSIIIDCQNITPGLIHLGFPEATYFSPRKEGVLNIDGTLIFKGKFTTFCDYNIRIYTEGKLVLGNNSKFGEKTSVIKIGRAHV